MLDHATLTVRDDWHPAVSPGDVILFAFPINRPAPGETAKTRPCVVLDVVTIDGRRHLLLAYGTTSDSDANRGDEIVVAAGAETAAAGVDRATRFVGARRLLVSIDHPGFATASGQRSPVIGRLTGQARRSLDALRTRLAATAALAARHRAQGGRIATPSGTVIVERRRLGPGSRRR
jgi:hypothetical protein